MDFFCVQWGARAPLPPPPTPRPWNCHYSGLRPVVYWTRYGDETILYLLNTTTNTTLLYLLIVALHLRSVLTLPVDDWGKVYFIVCNKNTNFYSEMK